MLGIRNMSSLISVNLNIIKQPDLNATFLDQGENKNRMKDYFFPHFAEEVLNTLFFQATQGKQRSFLISGRPGFGKTHLGLFIMNFFHAFPRYPIMEIMANVSHDFPLMKMKGRIQRFLVVNPLPITKRGEAKFDSHLISAINGALAREGIDFAPPASESAEEVYHPTIKYLIKKDKYKGMLIVMDNIEPIMEDIEQGAKSPLAIQVKNFFNFIRGIEDFPVIFVGIGSMIPINYITASVEENARRGMERVFDKLFWFTYQPDEWIEFVTTKILQHSSMEALDILITNPEFEKLANFILEAGLFKDKGIDYVKHQLLPRCFPLHPFTMIFLPKLSQKVCRKDKNLLAFFRDTAPGSFRYFLDTFGIFQASGKLSVYTPDYLFSYYEQTISEAPHLRNVYDAVERAYMYSGNLPLARRVIRLVALMQIINDEIIKPVKKNIIESLHVSDKEYRRFEPMLIELVQKGAFTYDRKTMEVTLPVEKSSVNLRDFTQRRIDRIKKSKNPKNILNHSYRMKEIPATGYNKQYRTDRKVMFKYIDIGDLRNKEFPMQITSTLGRGKARYRGDVAILYFITDNDQELSEARQILVQPEWEDVSRLVVAVPIRPCGFFPLLYEKEALLEIREEPPFSEPDSPDREALENHLSEISKQLKEKLEFYRRPDRLYWYYRSNLIRQMQEKTIEELADALMEENFPYSPIIDNPAVSSFKDKKKFREIRKRTVEKILVSLGNIKLPKAPADPSDKLIYDVLITNGLMEKIGEKDGFYEYAVSGISEMESPIKVIWNELYARIIEGSGGERRIIHMSDILEDLLQPPYGINPALLEILLAAIFRKLERELDIFRNFRKMQMTGKHTSLERIPLNYETIREMCLDPEDIIIYFAEFPSEEKLFVAKIYEMFTRQKAPESEVPLWKEAKEAIYKWFHNLPEMTRRNRTYKDKTIIEFMDMLEEKGIEAPPQDFFRKTLPETLGYDLKEFSYRDSALELLEKIKKIYITLTKYSQLREAYLWKAIQTIFAGKNKNFTKFFKHWKKNIPENIDESKLSSDARFLIKVNPDEDLKTQFLTVLPDRMGLKPFHQWETDKTLEYLARLSRAKLEIDVYEVVSTFTLPSKKEPKKEIAQNIFDEVFAKFHIPRVDQEVYIVELMERCVWEESK